MFQSLLETLPEGNFRLGNIEDNLTSEDNPRIIRVRTRINSFGIDKLVEFFRNYGPLIEVDGRQGRAVMEFFLDEFFKKAESKLGINVEYVMGKPGEIRETDGYHFKFTNDGRTIEVYEVNPQTKKYNQITEFSRLVIIRKGGRKQVIICDPRGRNTKSHYAPRTKAATLLLGKNICLSYMLILPVDDIRGRISDKIHLRNAQYRYQLAEFFAFSPTNLVMVYSQSYWNLKDLGRRALEMLKE